MNVAANVADIIDGLIARATSNRHPMLSIVGCKLDCYRDLVSHFVVPASLLMHAGNLSRVRNTLSALQVCTLFLRLSYFEVTRRCQNGACIFGVTSDYMVAIYVLVMHLRPLIGHDAIVYVLSGAVIAMMAANMMSSLRS